MSGMKDCKFCDKEGLLWLPLRYSVAVSDDQKALKALPPIREKLGKNVTDITLTNAKYAVRLLRPGYLYVLIERDGVKYWEAYRVLEDAFLYQFPADQPPQIEPAFSCDPGSCGINASMVAIPHAADVKKIWSFFTPSPLTRAKLSEYKNNADAYAAAGKMQTFSPADWLKGTTNQAHSLLAPELLTTVTEFVLFTQASNASISPLGKAMEQQMFPASTAAYAGTSPDGNGDYSGRLGALYRYIRKNGYAAFALYDHIGVTQELNNFRNAALHPIETFLKKTDKDGIENQRKMDVAQAIKDVKDGFIKHGIGVARKQIEFIESRQLPNFDEQNAKVLRGLGRIQEAETLEARARETHARRDANRKKMLNGADAENEWENKYAKLLDMDGVKAFNDRLAALSDACGKVAEHRADDHVHWVTADRLVDAFDVYDPADLGSGFCFTQEHALCTFGMFGIDKNKPKLAEWMKVSKVERKNLYMRANLYNQDTLKQEAGKAFTEAQKLVAAAGGLGHVAGVPWLKVGKGIASTLKKVDSAWDAWLNDKVVRRIHLGEVKAIPGNKIHNLSVFHRSNEGMMYARIAEWAQALSNKAGKMDKLIQATVGTLLLGRMDGLIEKIGLEDLMLKVPPEKLAEGYKKRSAQRNRELAERDAAKKAGRLPRQFAEPDPVAVLREDEQRKVRDKVKIALDELEAGERPETNNFRQARMGVLLMAIEGLALTLKLTDDHELSEKDKASVTAAMLSLASTTFDVVYAVAKSLREIKPYKGMAGVDGALDVVRGGLKMTSGTLSAAAGGISAVLDWESGLDELSKERKNWVLTSVYFSRALAGGGSLSLGLIAAFSYTGPLLLRMSGSGTAVAMRLAPFLESVGTFAAEKVAIARTLWLIRVARLNMIGLAITGAEIGYRCFIMDNDLENWCQACTFRKDKSKGWFSEKPYPDEKKELEELDKAYKAIAI